MNTTRQKNYFWNTIGVFLQNAISPFLLLVITRLNGINASGLFSFAFAASVILWALAMWGGRTYQVSDMKDEFSYKAYLVVRYVLAIVVIIIALLFVFINGYDQQKSQLIILLVIFKVIESIADCLYGILQRHEKLYIAGTSLTIKAIFGFLIFMIFDLITHNLLISTLALVVVNIAVLLAYDLKYVRYFTSIALATGELKDYVKKALEIMKRTAPVFAVMFLTMFTLNIPRYFLDRSHPEQIGIFGIIAMPITLIVVTISFILEPNIVQLATLHQEQNRMKLSALLVRIMTITIVIGLGIFILMDIFGVRLLQLVFGVDFSSYKTSLLVVVGGGVMNGIVAILVNILVVMRRFAFQFYILFVTNIVLVVVASDVVSKYSLDGAMWLFTITSIIQAALLALCYRFYAARLGK